MRMSILLAAALAASAVTPALADSPDTRTARDSAPRAVYVCGQDQATRRSFEARYGSEPVFVSATEAMAADRAGERWETPRCMSEREHARFERMRSERASVR